MAVDIIARAMAQNTKKQLTDTINNLDVLKRKIVDELPTTDISTQVIYMIPAGKPNVQNVYDEWFYVDGNWERIGSTEVNLENYVTFDNIKSGKNIKITKDDNKNLTIDNIQNIIMNFPSYVATDGTMTELIASLDENNTPTGIIYFGGITCSDLPNNMMQAELKIEVVKNSNNLNVYYFTIVSTNVSPYIWTGTGYQGIFSGWQARTYDEELKKYVKNTDYATRDTAGTVIVRSENGLYINSKGILVTVAATEDEITKRNSIYHLITPSNLNTAVKATLLDDKKLTFTEDETKTIRESLGAVGTTDYPTSTTAGVVKCNTGHGLLVGESGHIQITPASDPEITDRSNLYKPITPNHLNFAVKSALTDENRITGLTDVEKTNARGVIGAASSSEFDKLDKNFSDHLLDYETITSPTGGILAQAKKYTDDNKYDDTAIKADIKTNKDAIEKLNGTGEGSVTNTVNEAVAKVVGDAPESFDTLKEIADWIGDNPDGASAMNTAIKKNADDIAKKQDRLTFDSIPTVDSNNVLTSGTVASAIADFVKKTDYGTRTTPGIVSAQREYGIGIGGANSHLLILQNAEEATITARTDQYHAITSNRLNFAVKSALSDANRISDMTTIEKSNARDVINAEQAKTYQTATSADTLATSILLEDKKVIQNIFESIASLTITLPSVIADSFESEFSFKCSSDFSSITYPSNIIFRGVDCDKTGKFTPRTSVCYEVSVRCVGIASNGSKVLVGRVGEF